MIILRVVVGVLLLAHGLVHLLYLAPDVKEFSIVQSWLLPETARRPVALGLMLATVAAFVLVAFWNSSLLIGIAIDVVLVTVAVTRPDWADRLVG